jgi:Ice-binding-like/Bacterial Ig-like domain
MHKLKVSKPWYLAFLLALLVAGCGREQGVGPIPPAVASTIPANGAIGVALNSMITATFNESMSPGTINATTFTIAGPGGVAVAGAVTYGGGTATFVPSTSLAANTVYTATITTGAQNPLGTGLAVNYVWTFTTGLPVVLTTIPANGAMAVAVNTVVSATFDEVMDATTFTGATFTVKGPGAAPVAGTISYAGSTATFTPTNVLAASTLFTATITTGAKDLTGFGLAADYIWTFTTAPPPTVVSTVPTNLAAGVAINTLVSATFSAAMDPATITGTTFTLTGPGATPVAGVVTSSGSTATFTPTNILAANTLFTATITTGAKDPTGNPLAANYVWTFTTAPPPTVISTVPANAATVVALNAAISATFSEAMAPATIDATTFLLTGPGTTQVAGTVTYAGTTASFTPTSALAGGTLFKATITTGAADPTGNALAANYVWTFTTATLPSVTSTNPASAATNVPINQKITATFSEPMTSSTITAAGTFTLAVTTGGAAVTGVVTYDAASNSAIFTPGANLAASTQFTATITTAAQDATGHAITNNYIWNFTTGTAASAIAPTVLSADPANVTVNVPLNQRIAATFSEAMDPATISALGTVTVVKTIGAVPVAGTVTYDMASNTAIFTPSANLATATQFTVTISNAATDLKGNALIAGSVPNPWSFTTGAVVNATAPSITLTNPANLATAVGIDTTVSATFSAPMNPMTITTATFLVSVTATGAPVSGTVAYNVASQIATFTPSANLAASTQFTATISPVVQDANGNSLAPGAAANPWSFTTGTTTGAAGPATINLGSAGNFAVMATSSISSTGPAIINGDVGLSPGTSQGIPPPQVNGTIHVNDPVVTQAQADLLAAYNDAVSRSVNAQTLPGNMGGLTFTPGLYVNSTSVLISGVGPGNIVTMDAQGNPNAVFIFKMGSTLTTAPAAQVVLAGGAKAGNIFWQVGTSATIDTTTIFKGNVLAAVSITLNTGAAVEGSMYAGSGGGSASTTVNASTVSVPAQ